MKHQDPDFSDKASNKNEVISFNLFQPAHHRVDRVFVVEAGVVGFVVVHLRKTECQNDVGAGMFWENDRGVIRDDTVANASIGSYG